MPDSSSTTSPTGASLSDILFSFVLEKYIVCDVCGLRSPSFESSSVLYISPTDTSSMQNLILEGLQQKLQKPCSRCNKNTRHIESSYILQPPKYLLLFVNRFRYINNNITKDRCPIPMDTTVRLGPLKFSLQATIDHHGPSIDSGHYTASINCCKKHSIATITKLRSLELLIKTPLLHILYHINGLTHDFWTRTGGWEFDRSHAAGTSSPSHWQQVEEQAPKPVGWTMCFLLMTLVPVQKLCVNIYVYIYIYICMYIPYTSSVIGRIYNGSVIQYWRSCTPSRSIGLFLGSARFLGWMPLFVFFGLPIMSCSLIKSNTRMLVTFGICFKQHFDTRYLEFYNTSPPRMFLSLDLLWEYQIQHGANGLLYVTSSYSTWIFCRGVSGFATDCPCGVWCRGLTTCLLHVGPPFGNRILNNSWAVGLT